jgi:hypothetical protein
LGYWICADGQAVKKNGITTGVTLCTDSFTFEEVLNLKSVLENKGFGLKCTIHTKRKANTYYRIYITKISMPLLISLVSQHIHSSMLYKIGAIAKSRECMLEINKRKGIRVEVLDLDTNNTTTYDSIRKAAESIGCAKNAISYYEKQQQKTGVVNKLKGRYVIKVVRQ